MIFFTHSSYDLISYRSLLVLWTKRKEKPTNQQINKRSTTDLKCKSRSYTLLRESPRLSKSAWTTYKSSSIGWWAGRQVLRTLLSPLDRTPPNKEAGKEKMIPCHLLHLDREESFSVEDRGWLVWGLVLPHPQKGEKNKNKRKHLHTYQRKG